jgi:hypothetical protein
MSVDDLIKHYGATSDSDLAKKLSRGRSTICEWRANGIPEKTQSFYQVLTNGALKAELNKPPL